MVGKYKDELGIRDACKTFDFSEATWFRWQKNNDSEVELRSKPRHHRRLSVQEESEVLELLCSERFQNMAPEAIVACLLDENTYLASPRTIYRILSRHKAVKERRNQLRHPDYKKPELLATGPNQLWSWDITKLRTGRKHDYLHLYVIMDVFSRYTVGWLVANRESEELAEIFIADTCWEQGIQDGQLTIHADRGPSMKSKTVAQMMSDMGVERSHSRPHVSNDNPYSESQFKTLKYHADFPKTFDGVRDAKVFLEGWFNWYNTQHRHSGICMLTPATVHAGKHEVALEKRRAVMQDAYKKNPGRFPNGPPKLKGLEPAVYINKPEAA